MAATAISFRWLDILEKEFDEAFVDLDILIGDLDSGEADMVYTAHQKMATLSSCFAQLTHKAQTVFQNSAKVEAELVYLRAELIDAKAQRSVLDQELHTLLLQLHACQLQHLPGVHTEPDAERIRRRLEEELQQSPTHQHRLKEDGMQMSLLELASLHSELSQLRSENTALRNTLLALQSEVYGAKLTAKYLDKELAGRIQQLQLLGREMRGEIRDKLWRQLESEILLHRHKAVIRACRSKGNGTGGDNTIRASEPPLNDNRSQQGIDEPRFVTVQRETGEGLGISITGGREHGVPILISELEPEGAAAKCGALYVGDAILSANGKDLKQASHQEAVDILQSQLGDMCLEVQYIAAEDSDEENSLGEDMYGFRYRFFDDEVLDGNTMVNLHPLQNGYSNSQQNGNNRALLSTPTAPRTPESPNSSPSSPTSTTATNKPADCHSSSLGAASVQHSTNCTNPLSCHSDVNCSNINTDLSPYSPMQISTDGSHMGRSSNSEESLGKSPVKESSSYCETDQKSISVPSTPNNNSTGNRDLAFNGNNFESDINAHIGISTLQQVFGKSNSASSISLEHRSLEVVDDVKFKQDSGETVGTSDKSPVKSSEGAVALKTMNNGSEVMKGQKGKSSDFASKSPTKSLKQEYKNRELVMSELVSVDSSSAAGDGSSQPSPNCHKVGRKGVNTTSNYVLKLSDKGRRSGKAHRMVQNVNEGSSTSSSFDEEQMVAHRKVSSSKLRDGSLRNVAEASVLAVGNSPTHSSTEHRKIADRVVVDSFGDPDFGTPV
ncbi:Golgi-associated PDZ and coiled-coil motif-containing protein isoform X2 [Cryptotermes secundus]|uniref:Golgi-associated PDZ and coiled-coil motif-containing protein isoform X2 n=1 Tax=Cryptotermes secundus TaxID=105785 RepID=UPI000CD7AAEF|nr:Golgi-associated PDZ and coiled-coil motif-containing protein isoform X2 [Cryptotermes secundus]